MTFNAADEVFNVNYLPPPDVSGNYTTINRAITGLSTSTTSTTTPGGYPYKIENLDIEMLVPTTTPYSLTSSTPVLFTTTSAPVSLGLVVSFPPDTVVSPDDFRTAVTAAAEANSAINTAIIDNAVITTIDANDILMKLSTNINVDTWIDFVKLLRPSDFTELGTTQYIALYQNGSQSIYCNVTNSGCSNGIPGQEIDCIYPNYYCNSYEDIKTKQCNSI